MINGEFKGADSNMKFQKPFKILLTITLSLYCLILIYLLLLRSRGPGYSYLHHLQTAYNLIPFKSIAEYFGRYLKDQINPTSFYINIMGNLFLFFPMGVLLPCVATKLKGAKPLLAGVGMILAVEVVQYFTARGSFDVDDIILNSVGLVLGWLVFLLFCKIKEKHT